MAGIIWHIFSLLSILIFVIVTFYRTISIAKLPVHLRWELAPIPYNKDKARYGGSYLENYEWWNKQQKKSPLAPLIYMAKEIFLLRSIWKNNRSLWYSSLALHFGIYLIIIMLLLSLINAILIIFDLPAIMLTVIFVINSALAITGYILGCIGTISLIAKRTINPLLREFSSPTRYVNLIFLLLVFISGIYAWFSNLNLASELGYFIKDLIIFSTSINISVPLTLHITLILLFIIYLPFTDMVHFIAKYFTYHKIRWDDKPKDDSLQKAVIKLMAKPLSWSASHIKIGDNIRWEEIIKRKTGGKD